MPIFTVLPPSGQSSIDAGAMHDWLTERGYLVASVAVRQDQDGVPTAIVVDADRDPTADIGAYDGTPSQEGRRIRQLAQNAVDYAILVEDGGALTPGHVTAAGGFVSAMTAGTTPTAAQAQSALWVSMHALRATIRLLQIVYREANR